MGAEFFEGFELGDMSGDLGFDDLFASELSLAGMDMDQFEQIPGTSMTLVRPADGTLWEIQGDKVVRVNRASNIIEV